MVSGEAVTPRAFARWITSSANRLLLAVRIDRTTELVVGAVANVLLQGRATHPGVVRNVMRLNSLRPRVSSPRTYDRISH